VLCLEQVDHGEQCVARGQREVLGRFSPSAVTEIPVVARKRRGAAYSGPIQ
jgi:hypothetical protein